jgi:hypothetical protein
MEGAFGYYKMIGCKQGNSHLYISLIRSLIRLGDLNRASTCLEDAFRDAEARGEHYMMPALFVTQGMLALEFGETDKTNAAFKKAEAKALEIGSAPFVRTAQGLLQQSREPQHA